MTPLVLNMLVGSASQFHRPAATILALNGLLSSSEWPLEIDDAQVLVSLTHFTVPAVATVDLLDEEGAVLASASVTIAPRFKPSALARLVLRFAFEQITLPGPTTLTALLRIGGEVVGSQVWRVLEREPVQLFDGPVHVLEPGASHSADRP